MLKAFNCGYEGYKPSPKYWADMQEEYSNFSEEFKRVFNNYYIPEANYFKQEVLEEKYADMEIALPIDGEGHEFSKEIERLWDISGIPIGKSHDNPITNT